MAKVKKIIEVKAKEVKSITTEQLETIKDQQGKVQNLMSEVGFLEAKKHELLGVLTKASEDLAKTKVELEKVYGAVNIDLTDGSYTDVEAEDKD
jgi:hypothetical protein